MNVQYGIKALFRGLPRGEGDDVFTKEQLASAVSAAVLEAKDEISTSLGTKNTELLSDLKKAKDAIRKFDGIDPEVFKTMMGAFENDQDLKDIAEGRHKDVIERRIEKERAQFTSDLKAITDKSDGFEIENVNLTARVSKLLIDNNVVSEFVKEQGVETGIDDVVLRANQVFKVEGDDLIARGVDGKIIAGADGPLKISEWVSNLKETAPHLFPPSEGSGTGGGGPNGGGSDLASKIQNAAKAKDMKEYRRLRKLQNEGK